LHVIYDYVSMFHYLNIGPPSIHLVQDGYNAFTVLLYVLIHFLVASSQSY